MSSAWKVIKVCPRFRLREHVTGLKADLPLPTLTIHLQQVMQPLQLRITLKTTTPLSGNIDVLGKDSINI